MPCDGTVLAQADYVDLYATIGATYDTGGEGAGNFRLPDLRGRVRAMQDEGAGRLTDSWADTPGGTGGEEVHTLTLAESPSHSHTDTGHTHAEGIAIPSIAAVTIVTSVPSAVPGVGVTGLGSAALSNAGGDGAHANVQPTAVFIAHIFANF